jgi:hypothetical protein
VFKVTLTGINSEGAPLEMKWGKDLSATGVMVCVAQILGHKEEAIMMNDRVMLFNGSIVIEEY